MNHHLAALLFVVFTTSSLPAQNVNVQGTCLGTEIYTFTLVTDGSPNASGRNTYSNESLELELAYNSDAGRWEIGGGGFIFYVANSTFQPDPPASSVADYNITMDCTNLTGTATVDGPGTQTVNNTFPVFNVTTGVGYATITAAIAAVPDGSAKQTLRILDGSYPENPDFGSKNIRLIFGD